ncbi:MAG: DUF2946 domain-containing protein [Nevskiaceae bacterium]|nr:MAG: DUF2946 domain-containing protein [Nevskiaceae bacterium]
MSAALRLFVSRLLLIALVFNALTPLLAAAQEQAGQRTLLELCTASGLKTVAVAADGKSLPKPAAQNPCPFCLLTAAGAALPPAAPTLAYLSLQPEAQPAYRAPALPRLGHRPAAPPRGPPVLS